MKPLMRCVNSERGRETPYTKSLEESDGAVALAECYQNVNATDDEEDFNLIEQELPGSSVCRPESGYGSGQSPSTVSVST